MRSAGAVAPGLLQGPDKGSKPTSGCSSEVVALGPSLWVQRSPPLVHLGSEKGRERGAKDRGAKEADGRKEENQERTRRVR